MKSAGVGGDGVFGARSMSHCRVGNIGSSDLSLGGDILRRGKGRITCVSVGGVGLLIWTVLGGEGARADVWLGLFMTVS